MTSSGNDDMVTNGSTYDPLAQYARLSERVENQGKDIVDLRSNMNTGFQNVNANISALANDFRATGKTQWPIIIGFCTVSITILGGLGYLALQPIKDNLTQIREDAKTLSSSTATGIATIVDKMVTQKELEWRTARGAEDRQRTEASIKELREEQVPRKELDRVFNSYDQQRADIQRQLDEVKQAQGSVYGARDILLDLRERIDRIERQRLSQAGT
jgi:vacuolar-type H+-ATPase subunit I/STV1